MKRLIGSAAVAACLLPAMAVADPLTIGLAGPLAAGNLAGTGMKAAAELALADLIAAGRLPPDTRLVTADDACSADGGRSAAQQLIAAGARFVVGHFCSGSAISGAVDYAKAGVLYVTGTAANPDLMEQGHSQVFRVCGGDDAMARAAVLALPKEARKGPLVVVGNDKPFARTLTKAVVGAAAEAGLPAPVTATLDADGRFDTAALSRPGVAGVFIAGFSDQAAKVIEALKASGVRLPVFVPERSVGGAFAAAAPGYGGPIQAFGIPDWTTRPEGRKLAQRLTLGPYARAAGLCTYAAMETLAEAVGGGPGRLRAGTVPTILGPVSFDGRGDQLDPRYTWMTMTADGPVPVDQDKTLATLDSERKRVAAAKERRLAQQAAAEKAERERAQREREQVARAKAARVAQLRASLREGQCVSRSYVGGGLFNSGMRYTMSAKVLTVTETRVFAQILEMEGESRRCFFIAEASGEVCLGDTVKLDIDDLERCR